MFEFGFMYLCLFCRTKGSNPLKCGKTSWDYAKTWYIKIRLRSMTLILNTVRQVSSVTFFHNFRGPGYKVPFQLHDNRESIRASSKLVLAWRRTYAPINHQRLNMSFQFCEYFLLYIVFNLSSSSNFQLWNF